MTQPLKVLVACEFSGVVRRAFEARGRDAWSCDLLPAQSIQPWQFGHGETKRTCLWLKNLPSLTPTNVVDGREPRVHHMPPGPDRWRERSRFFSGIAEAMADQWGGLAQPQQDQAA